MPIKIFKNQEYIFLVFAQINAMLALVSKTKRN